MVQQAEDENLFMKLLDQFTKEGRNVTAKKGPSYAPKEFAEHLLGKGVSPVRFKHAMDKLLSAEKILNVTEGSPSKPRSKFVRIAQ